jgi:octaprenyl-diphosphate synthase
VREAIEKGGRDAFDEVLAAIHATGALDYARNQARTEAKMACAAINELPVSAYKDSLIELASFAVDRDH